MNRSGEWINNLAGNARYKSFKPTALPPNPVLEINSDMVKKLVEANRELVKLDTASKLIPNVELFISMYVRKEALISSQINQIEYYDRISEVRRNGNYEQWVAFFLEAVSAAAKDSLKTIESLTDLHEKNLERLPKTTRKRDNLRALFDYVEQYPIIEIKKTSEAMKVSYNTVSAAVKKLVELGILKETTNASRNRVFAYEEYLKILRKDT